MDDAKAQQLQTEASRPETGHNAGAASRRNPDPGMSEEAKRRFDALSEWKRSEFERINERRDSEWKMTLTLWAGLGALSLGIVTQTAAQNAIKRLPYYMLPLGALLLVALHAWFIHGVARRHHANRTSAYTPTCEMADLLGIPRPSVPNYSFLDWSRSVQLGLSILLALLVVVLRLNL